MQSAPLIPSTQPCVISLPTETHFTLNGIASRTLLQTANTRLVLFGFAAGQELTEHTSPHQAVVEILSGGCEFMLGQETHTLKAGDLVFMPPHVPHAVRATAQFSMLLTLVRVPESA